MTKKQIIFPFPPGKIDAQKGAGLIMSAVSESEQTLVIHSMTVCSSDGLLGPETGSISAVALEVKRPSGVVIPVTRPEKVAIERGDRVILRVDRIATYTQESTIRAYLTCVGWEPGDFSSAIH